MDKNVWLDVEWTDDNGNSKEMKLIEAYEIIDLAGDDTVTVNGVEYDRTANTAGHYTEVTGLGLTDTNLLNSLESMGYLNPGSVV